MSYPSMVEHPCRSKCFSALPRTQPRTCGATVGIDPIDDVTKMTLTEPEGKKAYHKVNFLRHGDMHSLEVVIPVLHPRVERSSLGRLRL